MAAQIGLIQRPQSKTSFGPPSSSRLCPFVPSTQCRDVESDQSRNARAGDWPQSLRLC
jgi:hypothetical protein